MSAVAAPLLSRGRLRALGRGSAAGLGAAAEFKRAVTLQAALSTAAAAAWLYYRLQCLAAALVALVASLAVATTHPSSRSGGGPAACLTASICATCHFLVMSLPVGCGYGSLHSYHVGPSLPRASKCYLFDCK